jgi:O-antigen ligase
MATAGPTVSPLSPRWNPALHQPVLSLPQHFGIFALMCYVFVLLTRLPEILSIHFGSSFSVVLATTVVAFLTCLISGQFRVLALSRLTLFYFALHAWFAATIPFSTWRFGSLSALRGIAQYAGMYLLIPLLARTERHLRLLAWSICASTLGVLVYTTAYAKFEKEDYARISTGLGRFGNSNDLALFLLMGMPFWMYLAVSSRYNILIRVFAGLEIAASVLQCLRTGSRGALLTLLLMAVALFFNASVANKARIAVLAVAVALLAFTIVPDSVRNRLASVVDSSRDESAAQSSAGRLMLLRESLEITARRPVFGVGLGVYVDAVLGISKADGQYKPFQQVPHNTFTTISAETGLPGLFLYLGCLITAWRSIWKARSTALRIPGMEDLYLLCGCIALAMLVFTWNNLFFSLTGDIFFYMTSGLALAAYAVVGERHQAYNAATRAPLAAASAAGDGPAGLPESEATASPDDDSETTSYPWLQPAGAAGPVRPRRDANSGNDASSQYGNVPWARNPRRRP